MYLVMMLPFTVTIRVCECALTVHRFRLRASSVVAVCLIEKLFR